MNGRKGMAPQPNIDEVSFTIKTQNRINHR